MDIEKANTEATNRMMEARPIVTGMAKAIEVAPGLHENMLLHAGPPVTWERMSGPMKGAMMGALIFEGKAKNGEEAEKMLKSGKIEFSPCHEHMCTGPMAGVISPYLAVKAGISSLIESSPSQPSRAASAAWGSSEVS